MTDVSVHVDDCGRTVGIEAHNHSGAGQAGEDVVCAAISTVLEVASAGLESLESDQYEYDRTDGRGADWSIEIHPGRMCTRTTDRVCGILDACRSTLDSIAREHPQHCSVEIKQLDANP